MPGDAAAPRSTLGVGITGHRPNKLPKAAIPRIERQLREAMAAIERLPQPADKPVRLISGFAEGADQMAVAAAPATWTVEAILPFPKQEYLKDFEKSAADDRRDVRSEFLASLAHASFVTELPTPASRNDGYLAAGRAMVWQIDLLIAVWDGEKPKSGGTGQIVRESSEAGLPVIWLPTRTDTDPVLIERFRDGAPVTSSKPWPASLSLPARPIRAAPA